MRQEYLPARMQEANARAPYWKATDFSHKFARGPDYENLASGGAVVGVSAVPKFGPAFNDPDVRGRASARANVLSAERGTSHCGLRRTAHEKRRNNVVASQRALNVRARPTA